MRVVFLYFLFGLFCVSMVGTIGVVMVGLYTLAQNSYLVGYGGGFCVVIVLAALAIQMDSQEGRPPPRFLARK